MDALREPKGHKNFYIDLTYPPGSVFTDGETVSGKCVLFSTHDEDVGTVTITFHGTVKSHVVVNHNNPNSSLNAANYNSEDVLFSYSKPLYQGTYTLRKNVPYEWPFEFTLPLSLLPSGKFAGSGPSNAQVVYELEAGRGRTWQDPKSFARHMNPRNDMEGAPFQPSRLFAKISSFTGMIALETLVVVPPQPSLVEPSMVSCRIDRVFPMISPGQSSESHHKISGLFHSHQGDKQGVICPIILELPRNLLHGSSIPVLLGVTSDATTPIPPISLQSIDIHLKIHTVIKSNPGPHRNTSESKVSLLNQSKAGLYISPNSWLDLGAAFNMYLDPSLVPNIKHKLVERFYELEAHFVIECGGKKFKEDFVIQEVQVISNKRKV